MTTRNNDELSQLIDKLVEEDCRQDSDSMGDECNIVTELFVADLKQAINQYCEMREAQQIRYLAHFDRSEIYDVIQKLKDENNE